MKEKLVTIVTGTMNNIGLTSREVANDAEIGIIKAAVAVLLMTSLQPLS